MHKLDPTEEIKTRYKPNLVVIIALASLILLGLGIQSEAIYSNYFFYKNSGKITICFYSPYLMSWGVQLFGILGLGISISILYKRRWKFLESNLHNLILLSPVLILLLDHIMNMYMY